MIMEESKQATVPALSVEAVNMSEVCADVIMEPSGTATIIQTSVRSVP